MKDLLKKTPPFLMFLAAFGVFLAVFLLRERLSDGLGSGLCALGGILLGFGAVALAMSTRGLSPEERKELERGETDERNVAIREKAALSTWYWTLYLLWAAFMAIEIFVGGLWAVAISAVIVLHCAFYMINIHRWNKRM